MFKSSLKTLVGELPQNVFSGFVVSLIALPLALGLALASGAPPISGVISSVVGGIVVSIFGGSKVTITGPGNGLVVVVLATITTLGNGDLYQGYLYTLAAIVISGILLILLGFLRMGSLGDFFPSSAIQGMLAAIGVGIFAKQFHVMLGNAQAKGSIISLLWQVPDGIINFIKTEYNSVFYAGILGIISLLIMIFYPKVRNKYLKIIPAPMWIVFLSIGLYYYFDIFSSQNYPIDKNFLISLPNNIIDDFAFPNFGKITQPSFISAVISITLIASIESLLSIKAVDKLDPLKRRSNVNKDIRALGLATVISGFIGGLNVVTVIARSSVNVNNKGSNKSSNLFHALFLMLFIILFSTELQKIPLAALAAILVYTGYKLASPENMIKIFKIGKEQLIIFFITLLTTIATSLITGIITGIVTTFVIHIFIANKITLFLRNLFKPNVLMFKEDDKYYVSVADFSNFLNYTRLKGKLDQIPEEKEVILDFSLSNFVDHSVMENMNDYSQAFRGKGGNFEVVGLDSHNASSLHPLALRKNITITQTNLKNGNLTKRQKSLYQIARDLDWDYRAIPSGKTVPLTDFGYFKTLKINNVTNYLSSYNCALFDVEFSEGELIAKQIVKATMLVIRTDSNMPEFTLDKEDILEYTQHFIGFKKVDISSNSQFSRMFHLSGKDPKEIKQFFTKPLISFFESNQYYHIESSKNGLLIIGRERLLGVKEIKELTNFGIRLQNIIKV